MAGRLSADAAPAGAAAAAEAEGKTGEAAAAALKSRVTPETASATDGQMLLLLLPAAASG